MKCLLCGCEAEYLVNHSLPLCEDCYSASEDDIERYDCSVEALEAEEEEDDDEAVD